MRRDGGSPTWRRRASRLKNLDVSPGREPFYAHLRPYRMHLACDCDDPGLLLPRWRTGRETCLLCSRPGISALRCGRRVPHGAGVADSSEMWPNRSCTGASGGNVAASLETRRPTKPHTHVFLPSPRRWYDEERRRYQRGQGLFICWREDPASRAAA